MSTLDDLYPKAKHIVLTDNKASTSYLQRRLQIGYNAAAALIERMEAEGVVSAASLTGKRTILNVPAEYLTPGALLAAQAKPAANDTPPWETDIEDSDAAETAETPAEAPAPVPTVERLPNDGTFYACSGCDIEAEGNADQLPEGWYEQYSATFGTMHRCPACSQKNAAKIATGSMSTEEIASAGDDADAVTAAAQSRLRSLVERCQRLLEDIAGLRGDLKEVLDEAKGEGFDVKVIRKLLSELQKDPVKRREERDLLELYATSIGEEL